MFDGQSQEQLDKAQTGQPESSWLALTDQKKVAEITSVKPIEEIKIPPLPSKTIAREVVPQKIPAEPTSEAGRRKSLPLFFKILGIIILVFAAIYLFMTGPALLAKFSYWWAENIGKTKPRVQTIIPESVNADILFLSTVTYYAPPEEVKKSEEKTPTKKSLGVAELGNDELWVPKLNVRVPIVWDSPVDEEVMQENLRRGVVHYLGTTKPDERAEDGAGNVFISGHSSYYWWDSGKYKTIFANLDQLEVGDEIAVGYQNKAYIYRVWEKIVVRPEEVGVLAQNTAKPNLSLMTCVPVGTNLKRLVVKSELMAVGSEEEAGVPVGPGAGEKPEEKTRPAPEPLPSQLPNLDAIDLLPWR